MNDIFVCKDGRIIGLENCTGEFSADPDFLHHCSCKDLAECVRRDYSNRISPEIFAADRQIQQ